MFSGAATKLIYICPVSSSCSPNVTSCHVEALIALSPLASLPLIHAVVSPAPPTRSVSLSLLPSVFSLFSLTSKKRECHLFSPSLCISLCAAVNFSPCDVAPQSPPLCHPGPGLSKWLILWEVDENLRVAQVFYPVHWALLSGTSHEARLCLLARRILMFCFVFFTMHESANSCVCPCEGEGALALYNSWSWIDASCMFS